MRALPRQRSARPPCIPLSGGRASRQTLLVVLAAVVDAHEDAELDQLVELLQRDAPDAVQLLGGCLLGLGAVAPAHVTLLAWRP